MNLVFFAPEKVEVLFVAFTRLGYLVVKVKGLPCVWQSLSYPLRPVNLIRHLFKPSDAGI